MRKANRIARKRARRNHEPISKQEMKVLELLRHGKIHKEIGNELNIATSTVSKHVNNVSHRLKVNKETALINKYLHNKHGIIDF